MKAKLTMVVLECRVKLVRPMDPAAIDDHHDLFASFAEDGHHLMDILAQLLGIKMRDDLVEDFGGPILDGAKDAQQDPTGDTAPGAILHPRLAFAGLLTFDLTLAQGRIGRRTRWAVRHQPARGRAKRHRMVSSA